MKFEFKRITIKMKIRVTALVTAAIFACSNTVLAQPAISLALEQKRIFSPLIPAEFTIPDSLGSIEAQFSANKSDRPFIAVIQDAHAVVDAQNHIQGIIQHLQQTYGIRVIALEGGQGRLDPTLFRTFPDEFLKKKVMTNYLNRAEITGAEMAAVLNPSEGAYYGIEDWDLYETHYLAYLRSVEKQEAVTKNLQSVREQLDRERRKAYSLNFNQFHEKLQAFENESTYLLELLNFLAGLEGAKQKLTQYPDLEKLYRSFEFEKETEEKKGDIESSVRQMADGFKAKYVTKMNIKQEMAFHKNHQAFVTGQMETGKYLQYLIETGESFGVKARLTPTMLKVLGHSQTLGTIKGTKLFAELESLIREIEEGFITNPKEKEIAESYRRLTLLEALGKLELTRDQWEEIQALGDKRSALRKETLNSVTLNAYPFSLTADFQPAREFYRLALERDKAFSRNLAKLLKDEKAKAAIVVAGGFHTQGFERNLKEEGYSYSVITPKIQSLEGQQMYAEVMQGKLSYKPYLKTTFYDAFVRDSSLKLVNELNETDFRKNIKLWRDEIIRKLSSGGRIAEAREYTRYLDLLYKIYHEKFGKGLRTGQSREDILKVIEKELQDFRDDSINRRLQQFQFQINEFAQGLTSLIKEKELNPQNVLALTEQVRQATAPSTLNLFSALPAMMPRERPISRMRPEIREFLASGRLVAETGLPVAAPVTAPAAVPTPVMVNALLNQVQATFETGLIRDLAQTEAVRAEAKQIVEGGDLARQLPLEAKSPENVQPIADAILARTAEGAARELPNAGPLTAGSAALALVLAVGSFLAVRQGQRNQPELDLGDYPNTVELNGVRIASGDLNDRTERSEVRAFDDDNYPGRAEVAKQDARRKSASKSNIEEDVILFARRVSDFYRANNLSPGEKGYPVDNVQKLEKNSLQVMRGVLVTVDDYLFKIQKANPDDKALNKEINNFRKEIIGLVNSINGVEVMRGGSETFKGSSDPTKVDPKKTMPGQAQPLKTPSEVAGEMLGKMGIRTPPPKRTESTKRPSKTPDEVYQLMPEASESKKPEQKPQPAGPQIPVESLPSVSKEEAALLEIGEVPHTPPVLPAGDSEVVQAPVPDPAPVLAPLMPTTINLEDVAPEPEPEVNIAPAQVGELRNEINAFLEVLADATIMKRGRGTVIQNLREQESAIRNSAAQLDNPEAVVGATLDNIRLELEGAEASLDIIYSNLNARGQEKGVNDLMIEVTNLKEKSVSLRGAILKSISVADQPEASMEPAVEPVEEEVGLEKLDEDNVAPESIAVEAADVSVGDIAPEEVGLAPDSAEAPEAEAQTSAEQPLTPEQEMDNFIYKYLDDVPKVNEQSDAEQALPGAKTLPPEERPSMPVFDNQVKLKRFPQAPFTMQFLETFSSGFIEELNNRDTVIEDTIRNVTVYKDRTAAIALPVFAFGIAGFIILMRLIGFIFTGVPVMQIAILGGAVGLLSGVALAMYTRPNSSLKKLRKKARADFEELLDDQHSSLEKLLDAAEDKKLYDDTRLAFVLIIKELGARLDYAGRQKLSEASDPARLTSIINDLNAWPARLKTIRQDIEKKKARPKSFLRRLWERSVGAGGRIRLEFTAPQKVSPSGINGDIIAAAVVGTIGSILAGFFTSIFGGTLAGIVTGVISGIIVAWIIVSDIRKNAERIADAQRPKKQTTLGRQKKQTDIAPGAKSKPPAPAAAVTKPQPVAPTAPQIQRQPPAPASAATAPQRKTDAAVLNIGGRMLEFEVTEKNGKKGISIIDKSKGKNQLIFRKTSLHEGVELKIGSSKEQGSDFVLTGPHMAPVHIALQFINGQWYFKSLAPSGTDARRKTYLETDGWQPLVTVAHPLEDHLNVLELEGNIPVYSLVNGLKALGRRRSDPTTPLSQWVKDYIETKQGVPDSVLLNKFISDRKAKSDAAQKKEQERILREYQLVQRGLNESPDVKAVLSAGVSIQDQPEERLTTASRILGESKSQIAELDRRAREVGANLGKANQQIAAWIQTIDQELQRRQTQQRKAEADQEAKDKKRYGLLMDSIIQHSKQKNYERLMPYVVDTMIKIRENRQEEFEMPPKYAESITQIIKFLDKGLSRYQMEDVRKLLYLLRKHYRNGPRSEVRAPIQAELTVGGFPIQITIPRTPLRDRIIIQSPALNVSRQEQDVVEGATNSRITLGRSTEDKVSIPTPAEKRSVSREALELHYINRNWYFQSLSETNGVTYQGRTFLKKDGWQPLADDTPLVEDLMNRWELEGIPVATIVKYFQRYLSHTEIDYKTIPMAALYPGELGVLVGRMGRELGERAGAAFTAEYEKIMNPTLIQSLINQRLSKAQAERVKKEDERARQKQNLEREVQAAKEVLEKNKAYQDFIRSDKTMLTSDTPEDLEALLNLLAGIRDRLQKIAPEGEPHPFIVKIEAQIGSIQDEFERDRKRLKDGVDAREKAALDRQKAAEQARNVRRYQSQIAGIESWRKSVPYTPDVLVNVLNYMITVIRYHDPSIEANLDIVKAVQPLKIALTSFGGDETNLVLLQTLQNYYARQPRSEVRQGEEKNVVARIVTSKVFIDAGVTTYFERLRAIFKEGESALTKDVIQEIQADYAKLVADHGKPVVVKQNAYDVVTTPRLFEHLFSTAVTLPLGVAQTPAFYNGQAFVLDAARGALLLYVLKENLELTKRIFQRETLISEALSAPQEAGGSPQLPQRSVATPKANLLDEALAPPETTAQNAESEMDRQMRLFLESSRSKPRRSEIRFAGSGLEFDLSEEGRQQIVSALNENLEVQAVTEVLSKDFRLRLDEARQNLDGNIAATLEALRQTQDIVSEVFSPDFEARIKSQLEWTVKVGLLESADVESVIWRVRAAALGEAIATITEVELNLADSMQGLSDATLQAFQNKLENALQALKTRASGLRMNIVIVEPDNETDRAYVEFALTQLKEFIDTAEVMYAANQKPNSRLRNLGFPVMSRRYDPANSMQTINDINEKQQALNGQLPVWFVTNGIQLQQNELQQPLTALRSKLDAMPEKLKKPFITAADRLFIALNGLSASQRQVILGDLSGEKLRQFVEEQQLGFPNTFKMEGGDIMPSISGLIQDLKTFQVTSVAA